ncbi:T9SS type A sorting domain-containing protein [Carboxylicivirga sp. RSCT41]|uniref:T9SS type A sorting domain-containing protein n=1 Tax=Carboxylicivirga agarovorans TaxID=3417570 RepID=UPI003D3313D1
MRKNYKINHWVRTVICSALFFSIPVILSSQAQQHRKDSWQLITENAEWSARAGLQIIKLKNSLFVMGGRTPLQSNIPGDSEIWGDVWKSDLKGKRWTQVLETDDTKHWPARAYFKAITKGQYMYILGGQNFNLFGPSTFFNDVWRSKDGIHWELMTADAPWVGRAGLSSFVFKNEIYVLGGSKNDDDIIVNNQPLRVYFNDVWKSKDGKNWELVTDNAPWQPRAGMRIVVKNGFMYLMGGESGFTPVIPGTPPPYYNDVWRSEDGQNWELITEQAPWSARPGHEVLLYKNQFILFGGFNLDPGFPFSFEAFNPMDIWMSHDGKEWVRLTGSPWNATSPKEVKYDFHAIVIPGTKKQTPPSILTVGGDRETFDFTDNTNYLNIDNDVWRFYPNTRHIHATNHNLINQSKLFKKAYPNPFIHNCILEYYIPEDGHVNITIYDLAGNIVNVVTDKHEQKGHLKYKWNGRSINDKTVKKGMYFVKMIYKETSEATIIIKK